MFAKLGTVTVANIRIVFSLMESFKILDTEYSTLEWR